MVKKIRNYVEKLFEDSPKSKKIAELKDELISNLIEKYNDLLSQGKEEEEAYNAVIASIGDISDLLGNLQGGNILDILNDDKERKKKALFISIAVALYIISVVPVIFTSLLGGFATIMGVIFMFLLIATATGLLVYIGVSKPKYIRENDTLVEEFKEWKNSKNKKKAVMHTVMSAFWTLIVATYLIISFALDIWSYSWIIFIIGAAINQIIKAIFELRGE